MAGTKYDEYLNLLQGITQHLKQEIEIAEKRVSLYEGILGIVKDIRACKRITKSRYEKLAKCSCPDFGMIAALEGMPVTNTAELHELFPYCGNIPDCCECWKSYIEDVIDTIGDGEVTIKNTTPLPSPTEKETEEPDDHS